MTQLFHSRVLKRNIGEKWVKYVINESIEKHQRSYYLQWSLTHQQQPPKHFELDFFSLSDLWLLSHKQGYFWTATARSSSSPKLKEVPLLELLLFWFYTFSQVFFYLIFFIIYKKILSSYRNVFFNISWEQFLPALFYVTEFELNTSVVISKKISFRVKT